MIKRADDSIADQLPSAAPLLRLSDLQAGDVLLTRGRSLEARAIAKLSGGRWSHAAIWLPNDEEFGLVALRQWFGLQLIESDDCGVGATSLRVIQVMLAAGSQELVACLQGWPEGALLLRHPMIASMDESSILRATRLIRETELWRTYPPLQNLISAASLPCGLKFIVRTTFANLSSRSDEEPPPGSFCSQLVAKFFEALQLPLFRTGANRGAEEVSPNALASHHSLLQAVDSVIVSTSDVSSIVPGCLDGLDPRLFSRTGMLASVVSQKATSDRTSIKVKNFSNAVRSQSAEILQQSRKQIAERDSRILQSLRYPNQWTNTDAIRRLYVSAILAQKLDQMLQEIEEASDAWDSKAAFHAALILREYHTSLTSQITFDHYRSDLLTLFRVNRASIKKLGKRQHRKLVKHWQLMKRGHADLRETIENLSNHSDEVRNIRNGVECQTQLRFLVDRLVAETANTLAQPESEI